MFAKAGKTVRLEVDGVITRQKCIARFGEQHDHHSHDHPDRRSVEFLGSELRLRDLRRDGLRVALDEQLGSLSDPFAEVLLQRRLAF